MKKEYKKSLLKLFKLKLQDTATGYAEVRVSNPVYPGQKVFQKCSADNICLFIVLVPHPKRDEFTIELGWSTLGKFPSIEDMGGTWPPFKLAKEGELEFDLPQYIIRVGNIASVGDLWWKVDEQNLATLRDLDPSNKDAIQDYWNKQAYPITDDVADEKVSHALSTAFIFLKTYGFPYLEKLFLYKKQHKQGDAVL